MSDFTDDIDWYDDEVDDEYVVFQADLVRETKKAYLLRFFDKNFTEAWLPKSEVSRWDPDDNSWVAPQWLADKHPIKYTFMG